MPTHTLMPCSESTKQSGNCVIQVQEDQKRNLSPCAARDAIMIPRHIFLVTVVSSALQAPTQLSTCIHTHTHTHTHTGGHTIHSQETALPSQRKLPLDPSSTKVSSSTKKVKKWKTDKHMKIKHVNFQNREMTEI